MRKRSRYDAEAESGGWIGRGVLGIGALALVMLAGGWWLFASNSDSSIRKFCLSRISVMVDRFDQASEAWKNRSVHAANANKKKPSPLTSGKSGVSAKDPAAPEPAPGPDASAPAEPAPITPGAEPAAAAPPGGQTAEQAVEPPGEVTAEDREALKKILASGTKPDPKSAAKPAPVKTEPRPEPKIEAKTDLREKPAAVPGKIEPNDQEQLRSLLKSLH